MQAQLSRPTSFCRQRSSVHLSTAVRCCLSVRKGKGSFNLWRQRATPDSANHNESDEEFEGLRPEEDWTVPGGYQDSMSSNTELGRAVQSACQELGNLSNLERESLTQATELLHKLGYKGNIFQESASGKEDN